MRSDLRVLAAPRLLPLHLLGVVATIVFTVLGLWQFQAWQAEREAAVRDLSTMPTVPLEEVMDGDDAFPSSGVGRPVALTGVWLPEATFYVTERELEGRDGFWAVTPVAVCEEPASCGSASAVLVVRGWTAEPDRAPTAPEGTVELTGWLQPPEGAGRPDADPTDDLLPELRIADAIQRVDQDLYGAYLIADEADPVGALDGLEPVTPASLPEPESDTGLRNLLYGIQWWAFTVFALYVWWRWAKDELERAQRARNAEVPSDP